MCGIFGYVGDKEALPILLEGLKSLEYRGYDSAGVAVLGQNGLCVRKAHGRLENLRQLLKTSPVSGTCGVGHTRWATHGGPTDENAHPHTDMQGRFAVVHNGIIENFGELRAWLMGEGYSFVSETDTEVIAHLLSHFWRGDLLKAVRDAVGLLRGSFALGVLCQDVPGTICATRVDSPLIVGVAGGEMLIASDIPALLPHTRRMVFLKDREMVLLTREGGSFFSAYGQPMEPTVDDIALDPGGADLGGYPHYMLKEMHEQPAALRAVLAAYTEAGEGLPALKAGMLPISPEAARGLGRLILVGCGSAYHAAVLGKAVIERLARLPVEVDIASEFRYRDPILRGDDLCIFISQSGETADTLAALRLAAKRSRTLGIVNAVGSTLSREADGVLYTLAGPEIAVATTKGYMTQVMALVLVALYLAKARGKMDDEAVGAAIQGLSQAPAHLEALLDAQEEYRRFATEHVGRRSVFYLGRGADYAVALEASLKLKEVSYIHSEAYAAGELKHGTIALIEPGALVVALSTEEALVEKMRSNIREVKARGAEVLVLTTKALHTRLAEEADVLWTLPDAHQLALPLLSIAPMQALAYAMALARGCDVDKPRNLAKSVTVE